MKLKALISYLALFQSLICAVALADPGARRTDGSAPWGFDFDRDNIPAGSPRPFGPSPHAQQLERDLDESKHNHFAEPEPTRSAESKVFDLGFKEGYQYGGHAANLKNLVDNEVRYKKLKQADPVLECLKEDQANAKIWNHRVASLEKSELNSFDQVALFVDHVSTGTHSEEQAALNRLQEVRSELSKAPKEVQGLLERVKKGAYLTMDEEWDIHEFFSKLDQKHHWSTSNFTAEFDGAKSSTVSFLTWPDVSGPDLISVEIESGQDSLNRTKTHLSVKLSDLLNGYPFKDERDYQPSKKATVLYRRAHPQNEYVTSIRSSLCKTLFAIDSRAAKRGEKRALAASAASDTSNVRSKLELAEQPTVDTTTPPAQSGVALETEIQKH